MNTMTEAEIALMQQQHRDEAARAAQWVQEKEAERRREAEEAKRHAARRILLCLAMILTGATGFIWLLQPPASILWAAACGAFGLLGFFTLINLGGQFLFWCVAVIVLGMPAFFLGGMPAFTMVAVMSAVLLLF